MPEVDRSSEGVEAQVRRVVAALKRRNGSGTPDEVIEQAVREAFAEREGAKIKDFVSVLAEREARERLRRTETGPASSVTS